MTEENPAEKGEKDALDDRMNNKPLSPRRKSPEKKNVASLQDTLQAAKRTFLTSTETKSPLKRPLTPEPDLEEEIPSPASVKKVGIVTPSPHKKAKVSWKTRWQSTVGGGAAAVRGKRGGRSEADKLLGDEGVIQMLHRVPSVHGIMPKSASSSSSRVQRARSAASKPNAKPERKKLKREDIKKEVKLEPVEMPEAGDEEPNRMNGEFVSPRRAVKNLSRESHSAELQDTLRAVKGDDCFAHLNQLPAEQMDLLMNCDIRYSLPKQGGPKQPPPGPKQPASSSTAGLGPSNVKRPLTPPSLPDSSSSLVKVRPVSVSVVARSHGVKALFPSPPLPVMDGSVAELLASYRARGTQDSDTLPSLVPGQYNAIYVRLFETFAQVTLASPKARLKGSLGTQAMEELVHALSYVAAAPRLRGLLVTGVGTVFCQGIDLTELCLDRQERRKEAAVQMANALERLVLALSSFPKLLVAAVNGVAVGLGVTLLPLFDIVYANDKAQFSSFYSRLGQVPEACASVLLPMASPVREMLLLGRALSAQELVTLGLVTQSFFPGRLMEETIPRMRKATGDALSAGLQWNKMALKQNQKLQVEQTIGGEIELLKEMWSSRDYHVNLVKFINSEKCLEFQKPPAS